MMIVKTHALDPVESCRGVSTTAGTLLFQLPPAHKIYMEQKNNNPVWVWGSYSVMGQGVGQL